MYVRELREVTVWIDANIVAKRLAKRYGTLHGVLASNTQGSTKQPFEAQKNDIVQAISDISFATLSEEQITFLYIIGIADHVGTNGVQELEDILFRNSLDLATAGSKIQAIVKQIEDGVKRSEQIKAALQGIPTPGRPTKGDALLRVRFTGEAVIRNVVDLKQWAGIWFDIGRGIAMVHDRPPEEIEIIGAETGSIILDVAVAYLIAKTASFILLESLKVAERVLDMRLKAEQWRGLKLNNDKIASDMDKQAENEREKRIDFIVAEVVKQLPPQKIDGEKRNALTKSVENLVRFTESGGQVDCVLPAAEPGDKDEDANGELARRRQELVTNFEQIRALESKLRLLEHKPLESPPAA